MKPTHRLKQLLFTGMLLISSVSVSAQDWQWKWGAPDDRSRNDIMGVLPMGTDPLNRICVGYSYNDSLVLHDTVFGHQITNPYTTNLALALYTNDGTFTNAIDIFTNANGNIWTTFSHTDTSGNIYIACEFQVRAFINGTVINHGPGPYSEIPDIFLAKLDPDGNVLWVKLIWGTGQSTLDGFEIGHDQQLYLSTSHQGNGSTLQYVNFFGADSSYYIKNIQCILNITPDGALSWRKEIRSQNGSSTSGKVSCGEDGTIYHLSQTTNACYIGTDTIHIPAGYPANTNFTCLLTFNTAGQYLQGHMTNNRISITDIKAGAAGELFFSGICWDTAYVAGDTLTIGADSTGSILGKADGGFNVLWYQVARSKASLVTPIFNIVPDAGDLYFAATFMRNFQFAGQTFQFGNYRKVLVGRLLPGGILGDYTIGQATGQMAASGLMFDNCRNLVLTGAFSGEANLGKDTLYGFVNSGFMAFLQVHPATDPGLGNDTTGCKTVVLHAGKGYSNYLWNPGASTGDSLAVTETGWYSVTVRNEKYCRGTDSVFVTITVPPDRLLGNDTSIYRRDSVRLTLNVPFDHCLWSTGDTTSSILVKGTDLGVGQHLVTVHMSTGPCEVTDSIQIKVAWSPGLHETTGEEFSCYPNPFDDKIMVVLPKGYNHVTIYGPEGNRIVEREFNDQGADCHEIRLDDLPQGVYLIRVITGRQVYTGKLIRR